MPDRSATLKGLGVGLLAGCALGAGAMAPWHEDGGSVGSDDEATTTIPRAELARLRGIEERHADGAGPALEPGAEVVRLRAELAAAREHNADLERRLAVPTTTEGAVRKPIDATAARFRFGLGDETPVFDQQDWSDLGGHLKAWLALAPEMRDDWMANGMPSSQMVKKLNPHSMSLMPLMSAQDEIEGRGPYGPIGHPAVVANLLRSALVAVGLPLSGAQEDQIRELGDQWNAEWTKQGARLDPAGPEIERMAAEAQVKYVFIEGVRGVLTPEQRAALWPENIQDRIMLDIFSPAGLFMLRMPLTVSQRAELRDQIIDRMLVMAKATGLDRSLFGSVADRWIDAIPAAYLEPVGATSLEAVFPHLTRLQALARAQIAAVREVLSAGHLDADQAAALRGSSTLITPYLVN